MPLKIVRAADPITVDRLNMVIYGPPGISKTSVAFTAEDPLLLDFDNGSHRAPNRKDVVRVSSWADVAGITADDLAPFKTVIVDTAGRALDALTVDIIRANPKHGRGGALTLQGYGELKSRFGAFLKLLNSFGKDVVLIAHMDEQRSGDDVIERLDVQGGSKGEVYKTADAMGRIVITNGKRRLLFSPTDAAFGKNPGGLEPLDIPPLGSPAFDGFLAGVIQMTKDRLNEQTEAQREAAAEQEWFRTTLAGVNSAQELNGILGRARNASQACKIMVRDKANALGLEFHKESGTYALPKMAA
ncbi:ATP-binding protein [Enterovirga sp. CN4-39]|uniref:ATP-binding protein n=1 Tax=Enterovirga sp. CN4-39 TaxID=3400910 RepID=UPI003C0DCF29